MAQSFTLDGKRYRLPASIPTSGIRWLVGKLHVSLSDDEVRKLIGDRTKGWQARFATIAGHYAVKCHRDNQALVQKFRL